jgi:hypothetical protein
VNLAARTGRDRSIPYILLNSNFLEFWSSFWSSETFKKLFFYRYGQYRTYPNKDNLFTSTKISGLETVTHFPSKIRRETKSS